MRRPSWVVTVTLVVAGLALTGCGESVAPPRPNVRVSTHPELVASFASLGGMHQLDVDLTDTFGVSREGLVTWDVVPPSTSVTVADGIVTVSPDADAGDYRVRATVEGVSDTALVLVLPRPQGKLVFTAASGTVNQVFVMDFAAGGDAVQVTSGPSASGGIAVDQASGDIIASLGTLPNVDLYRMRSDGSGLVNLTNDPPASNQGPAVHPITGEVFFSRRGLTGTATQIFRMAPDGTGLSEVTTGAQGKLQPAISPTGERLSWSELFPGFNLEVVTAAITGSNPVRFTDRAGSDGSSHWISNTRLVWGAAALTEPDVFVADLPEGANPVNLTSGIGRSTLPSAGCSPNTITVRRTVNGQNAAYQLDLVTGLAVEYTLPVPRNIFFLRRIC